MGLTPKMLDLLAYIRRYVAEKGYAPNFQEMLEALDLCSKSNVHRLLTCLEERGYVRRLPNKARAIELLDPDPLRDKSHSELWEIRNRVDQLLGLAA